VRGISKLPIVAALLALLLSTGLAACGGGGGGDSSSTGTEVSNAQTEGKPTGEAPTNGKPKSGGEGKSAHRSGGESGSAHFVPEHHHDSGGGSQQFRVKGGDNSIQEFGAEAEAAEFEQAAVALHDFLDARAAGDWAAACSYLSSSQVESFKQLAAQAEQVRNPSCAGILKALTNPAAKQAIKAEAAQADVRSLRVKGDRAFVIYTGPGGTVFAMPMAREGGTWKVAGTTGTPLS
jgi:hypothetical protein